MDLSQPSFFFLTTTVSLFSQWALTTFLHATLEVAKLLAKLSLQVGSNPILFVFYLDSFPRSKINQLFLQNRGGGETYDKLSRKYGG